MSEGGSATELALTVPELLFTGGFSRVAIPTNPLIPRNLGVDVEIAAPGLRKSAQLYKDILARYVVGLGVAKVFAEAGGTQRTQYLSEDYWANTRIMPDGTVRVFSRTIHPLSRRRPAGKIPDFISLPDKVMEPDELANLQKLFQKYLPPWEGLASSMKLFDGGVNGEESKDFKNISTPFWTNDRIEARIMRLDDYETAPWQHIPGIHILVSPREKYQRQWQTTNNPQNDNDQPFIQVSAEVAAVALGIRELLGGRGEIHNSGNWAPDLGFTDEEIPQNNGGGKSGKVDPDNLKRSPKSEKRKHFTRFRVDSSGNVIKAKEGDIETSCHFHVYVPEEGDEVVLPPMWPWEAEAILEVSGKTDAERKLATYALELWKNVTPISDKKIDKIQEKLGGGKLTRWLKEHCAGPLLPQVAQGEDVTYT